MGKGREMRGRREGTEEEKLMSIVLFGYISDRLAHRKPLMYIGLISLGLSTILLCVGRTMGIFIAGRALQGGSAAMVGSVGLALICDTVPKHKIGQAMGYITIGTGMATVLAPVLGGLVFQRAGYTAVFAMAFGFIGLDLVLRMVMIEKRDAVKWETTVVEADIEMPRIEGVVGDAGETTTSAVVNSGEITAADAVVIPQTTTPGPRTPSKSMPAFKLLASPAFLATLWGTCVLGSILTAIDSVSTPLLSLRSQSKC